MEQFENYIINQSATVRDALIKLNKIGAGAIQFIVDDNMHLVGALTDGDVRRGLIENKSVTSNVMDFVNPNPKFIRKGEVDLERVIELKSKDIFIIPVLNQENDQIVRIINLKEIKSYLPVDAVIMAGGEGRRLRPLTEKTPKPLLPVGNKPIIEHNLDRLLNFGIDDVHISVKYLGEQIEDYFTNTSPKNAQIDYVWESEPLGTIGAMSKIEHFKHDYILLTNSDLLTNLDYEAFFLDFLAKDADMSIVSIPYSVDVPYAVLETENNEIKSFKEKPTYTYYSNGGIYLIKKEHIGIIPKGEPYNATDFMEHLINAGKKVISFPMPGYWLDVGKHNDYEKAQQDIDKITF